MNRIKLLLTLSLFGLSTTLVAQNQSRPLPTRSKPIAYDRGQVVMLDTVNLLVDTIPVMKVLELNRALGREEELKRNKEVMRLQKSSTKE